MSYQTNPGSRAVEESYCDASWSSAINGKLLPNSNINVGASNSARGQGTTTAELVAKFRFLNCGACVFIVLFHTLPKALNPIQLSLLVASPITMVLEVIVGLLALFLFLVEARIPILGQKALVFMRGGVALDLDVARGRVLALGIMAVSLFFINYMAHGGFSSVNTGDGASSDEEIVPSVNATDSESFAAASDGNASASILLTIVQCIVFSPSILVVAILATYTLHVMHEFPEYAEVREYAENNTTSAPAVSSGPSWVSNVGSFAQGYQTVGN